MFFNFCSSKLVLKWSSLPVANNKSLHHCKGMAQVQPWLASAGIALNLSMYCSHDAAVALFATGQREWTMFSLSMGRYYHVALWLSGRVRYFVSAYEMACGDIAWIDEDLDEDDPVADDEIEMHRGYCQSLRCSYAFSVQIALCAEPMLQNSLGVLVFALEMVTESEVEQLRDADQFFFDLLGHRVRDGLDRVLSRFE